MVDNDSGTDSGMPFPSEIALGQKQDGVARIPDIKGYQVIRKIGEGGMGTVWEAIQLATRRRVAVKVLRDSLVGSDLAHRRFGREVQLAARLNHPRIANVYEGGVDRGVCYFAMEFVDGIPLDRYIAQTNASIPQVLEIVQRVCAAVQYAHDRGVLHRDLKPTNVLVSPTGEAWVVDFGLAKPLTETAVESLSVTGDLAGTPAFMSPEQIGGRAVGPPSDVYSLGVILYRLLLGSGPHDTAGSQSDLLRRIDHEEPRRPRDTRPDLSPDLEAILLKSVARDPEQRYPTPGELGEDLERFRKGLPLRANLASADEPLDIHRLYDFVSALREGDFSSRLPTGQAGRTGEVTRQLNALARQLAAITSEVTRVSQEITCQGRLGGWVDVVPQSGDWKPMIDAVNSLTSHVTALHRDITRTLQLAASGDGSRPATTRDCYGEELALRDAVNAVRKRINPPDGDPTVQGEH
jgi:serine/threonine protein kinase